MYFYTTNTYTLGGGDSPYSPSKEGTEGFLDEFEHVAISSVHAFLQNLYFYATTNTTEYR
jgi:hypothetical protein